MTGVIGAMDVEINRVAAALENVETEEIAGLTFRKGTLHGQPLVAAKCGVGKVNAAMCAQIMILTYGTDLLINVGVAGGIARGAGLKIGDSVVGTSVAQHDVDLTPLGLAKGMLDEPNMSRFPCDPSVSARIQKAAEAEGLRVFRGALASGDQFIASEETAARIHRESGAVAVEMESGAIGQVCYLNGVKFCAIRSISDAADEAADVSFPEFCEMAAERSLKILSRYLETENRRAEK
jgi:adenosylhomocysteine nucleosidase